MGCLGIFWGEGLGGAKVVVNIGLLVALVVTIGGGDEVTNLKGFVLPVNGCANLIFLTKNHLHTMWNPF